MKDPADGGPEHPPGGVTVPIEGVDVSAYRVPTDLPEADGTLAWDSTTLVVVEVRGGGQRGLGYTYADAAAGRLVQDVLAELVQGRDAMAVTACYAAMLQAVRNLGRTGLSAMAVAAVDGALWDLKARLLGLPLVTLLGAVRDSVPVYGSGGFTSYSLGELERQLAGWVDAGIPRVKMKVGARPEDDAGRVRAARRAIGPAAELFVDANGAYSGKQALAFALAFAEERVTWFEEPVSSDDLAGLRWVRERGPAGMDVTAGEYGFDLDTFRRMVEAGAVDVLQADATRCAGVTGFLQVGALCDAFGLPLSAHTAPALHTHLCCAVSRVRHLEYFHDHVRIEHLLLDGAPVAREGRLAPDRSRPGIGLELRRSDAARYVI